MKKTVYLICFVFIHCNAVFSQTKIDSLLLDTVHLSNKIIELEIPYISSMYKNIFNYTEGVFINYPFIDSSLLFIHFGGMVESPFLHKFQFCNIKETIETDNGNSCRGFSDKKYFREDYYTHYKISIVCKNIPSNYVPLFNHIMDSVKIILNKE